MNNNYSVEDSMELEDMIANMSEEDQKLLLKLDDMDAEVKDCLERLMGDGELYLEYIRKFPQNENIKKLREAVDAKDSDTAMKEVHTLKGVALNLGLLPLVDACMDMLLDFREDNIEEAMAQIEDVEECFQEWAELIEE